MLRFSIDTQARTATLVQMLTDPLVGSSSCCGSARLLPGGNWVVDWGMSGIVDELSPDAQPVFRLSFSSPYYSYRAVPILPGQLSLNALLAGMDAMTPRIPSGARPPALSRLHVSYQAAGRRVGVRFTLAWPAQVRFALARCVRLSPANHRCTRFARPHLVGARAGRRGANRLVLLGRASTLAPGVYRLSATSVAKRRAGQRHVAVFRIA